MKGIILAGGSGTRLYPLTIATSKQMLPVYDKPMIYYPLSTLMLAGIKDILIITTPEDSSKFKHLLGDGSDFGIKISYAIQPSPDGLAQAFIIGEKFIDDNPCAMILGDNIFYGDNFIPILSLACLDAEKGMSSIIGYEVQDPQRFGVVEFDSEGNAISIEEKPVNPRSNYCVTGLYFYGSDVCNKAKTVKPSKRGELEITDLNSIYLNEKRLKVHLLKNNFRWWDTGTFDSLIDASVFMYEETKKKGTNVCSPELIAYQKGWITKEQMEQLASRYKKNSYGQNMLKSMVRW